MSSIYTCNTCGQKSALKNHYGRNRWDPEDSCIFNHFQCLSQMPELDFQSLLAGALTDCSGQNCPGFTDARHRDHAVLIDPVGWGQKCLLSKYCDNTILDRLKERQSEHSRRQVPMNVAPARVVQQLTPCSRQTPQIPHVSPSEPEQVLPESSQVHRSTSSDFSGQSSAGRDQRASAQATIAPSATVEGPGSRTAKPPWLL